MTNYERSTGRIGGLIAATTFLFSGLAAGSARAQETARANEAAPPVQAPIPAPAAGYGSTCYDLADDPVISQMYPYVGLWDSPEACRYLRRQQWRNIVGIGVPAPLPPLRPVRTEVVVLEPVPVPVAGGAPFVGARPRPTRKPLGDEVSKRPRARSSVATRTAPRSVPARAAVSSPGRATRAPRPVRTPRPGPTKRPTPRPQ